MELFQPVLSIPKLLTNSRNPMRLYRNLSFHNCFFGPSAFELMCNHSFLLAPANKTYEFGGIYALALVDKNPEATVEDLLTIAKDHDLHVVDQTIPFHEVDNLLVQNFRIGNNLPKKWTFISNSWHTDGILKPVLVTVGWQSSPDAAWRCYIDGFRPKDGNEVLLRELTHDSIKGSLFIFESKINQTPLEQQTGEVD